MKYQHRHAGKHGCTMVVFGDKRIARRGILVQPSELRRRGVARVLENGVRTGGMEQ